MGFVYFLFVCFVGLLLISAAFKVGKSFRLGRDMYSSFECGFQSLSNARIPFSLKFYLLAIIFLLFDVELVLILPFFFSLSSSVSIFMFLFFSVLLFGLVHECNEGSLEWS